MFLFIIGIVMAVFFSFSFGAHPTQGYIDQMNIYRENDELISKYKAPMNLISLCIKLKPQEDSSIYKEVINRYNEVSKKHKAYKIEIFKLEENRLSLLFSEKAKAQYKLKLNSISIKQDELKIEMIMQDSFIREALDLCKLQYKGSDK